MPRVITFNGMPIRVPAAYASLGLTKMQQACYNLRLRNASPGPDVNDVCNLLWLLDKLGLDL